MNGNALKTEAVRFRGSAWGPAVFGLALAFTLGQPYSDFLAETVMNTWWDQSRYLESLRAVLSGADAIPLREGWHGPGYIWLAKILCDFFFVDPFRAFIVLNRISIGASIIAFSHLVYRLEHKTSHSQNTLARYLYVAAFILAANLFLARDIPWSHFTAAPLILGSLVTALIAFQDSKEDPAKRRTIPYCFISGVFAGLLFQVRMTEAIVMAGVFIPFALVSLWINRPRKVLGAALGIWCISFVFGALLPQWGLHLPGFHKFYFTLANLDPATRELLHANPLQVPLKFVQMFFDVGLFTRNDTQEVTPPLYADGFRPWRSPLLLQMPIYVYFFGLLILILVHRTFPRIRTPFHLRTNAFAWTLLFSAAVIAAGYLASPIIGSLHLDNGIFRDFITPTFLIGVALAPGVLWTWPTANKSSRILVAFSPIVVAVLFAQMVLPRLFPLSFTDAYTVASASAEADCDAGTCRYHVTFRNFRSEPITMPFERLVINSFCPNDKGVLQLSGPPKLPKWISEASRAGFCIHSFTANCRELGKHEAFSVNAMTGTFPQPMCDQPPQINLFAASLGNAHLPADSRNPPILFRLKWNGHAVEPNTRWLKRIELTRPSFTIDPRRKTR